MTTDPRTTGKHPQTGTPRRMRVAQMTAFRRPLQVILNSLGRLMMEHVAERRVPWNKGKFTVAKPPLRLKHVWSIQSNLQIEGRKRDLAMFNLAIDSKLRGCNVVSLRVEDVAPHGHVVERATIRQRKTGAPVKFGLTEQTREAIDA
jgi:hypothetical protein